MTSLYSSDIILKRLKKFRRLCLREKKHKGLLPFIEIYIISTNTLIKKRKSNPDYFSDIREIERLAGYFAEIFFQEVEKFLKNESINSHWANYIRQSSKYPKFSLINAFVGAKIHITKDLYPAICISQFDNKKDFFKYNNLLWESFPEVLDILFFKKHKKLRFPIKILKPINYIFFEFTIKKWRKKVWKNLFLLNVKSFSHSF